MPKGLRARKAPRVSPAPAGNALMRLLAKASTALAKRPKALYPKPRPIQGPDQRRRHCPLRPRALRDPHQDLHLRQGQTTNGGNAAGAEPCFRQPG